MPTPERGLYETLITEELEAQLEALTEDHEANRSRLDQADAPDRIALHISRIIHWAVSSVPEKDRVERGIELVRDLIDRIDLAIADGKASGDRPISTGELLRTICARLPDGTAEQIEAPLIPLLDTTLLTNSPDEPRVGHQLLAEIHSADGIDVVMAFIRRTGIRPMLEALRRHCDRGLPLRILTTTYTHSTELSALEQLAEIGAEIRVSYDISTSRLHAKAWLFHRKSGYSTAYIGSSNLTFSAQQSGMEWNVRASGARNPDVINKVRAVFESYWNSFDFRPFDREEFATLTKVSAVPTETLISPVQIHPYPFQQRLLELIAVAREQGHHRNLLVSATGTGKTVMAAIDYLSLLEKLPRARLLFVAHRKEILQQSLATFRQGIGDGSFGELWVDGSRPRDFEHVFASIQSLHAAGVDNLAADHFDVVIVDEFHHAAANTYRKLLEHVKPVELLGMTATPERSDALTILDYFDGRIAAELRLWDAIDQHRLCPFIYYGLSDHTDLRDIPWRRGKGYDAAELTNLLTADDINARLVLEQLGRHVDNLATIRCLGFCVSVAHAKFMARVFDDYGVTARAVWGETPKIEREATLRDLESGALQVLFSVDLFNEGVDVPDIDTVLFLRPTDSSTLFLQQLGRGLRKKANKTACTVLDFVGQHRKEFRFDRRFAGLFPFGRKRLIDHIEKGFPFLPAGCHMELDRVAQQRVLDNIRGALPSNWTAKAEELRRIAAATPDTEVSLALFLEESGLDLEDIYKANRSWSDLREGASLDNLPAGREEPVLRRACGRLLHIDDLDRIGRYQALLENDSEPDIESLSELERRNLRMLVATLTDQAITKDTTLLEATRLLWEHSQVRSELRELFNVLKTRVDHLHLPLDSHPDVPLQLHGRYTRIEIQAAFGIGGTGAKVSAWREGVRWIPEARSDLLAFTLDKSSSGFSPTTRYRDYAISPNLIHWESQGVTRANSEAGQRYQNHLEMGTSIFLFARLRADDRAFWFLGPATYVKHQSERPMQVTWRLQHDLPGDLFAAFAAAVA